MVITNSIGQSILNKECSKILNISKNSLVHTVCKNYNEKINFPIKMFGVPAIMALINYYVSNTVPVVPGTQRYGRPVPNVGRAPAYRSCPLRSTLRLLDIRIFK